MEKMNTSVCCGLEKRKRFTEVPDGRTQMQRDTLLCLNDTKFSLLLVRETVGSSQQHLSTCLSAIFSRQNILLRKLSVKITRLLAIVRFLGFVIEIM